MRHSLWLSLLFLAMFVDPAQSAEPLIVSSKTYTVTAASTGQADSFSRCLQALRAAKAALPKPRSYETAHYDIVHLIDSHQRRRCVAKLRVTIRFQFPPDFRQMDETPSRSLSTYPDLPRR